MASIIIDVNIAAEDAAAKAKELANSIKAIKDEQKGLKKSGDENSASYVQNAQQLRTLQSEQKSYIQLSQSEVGSNNQLRAQLALLTKQYNELSKEERDNTEVGKTMNAQIKATSDELKVNESAVGDNRRNVGNYKDALGESNRVLENSIPGYRQASQALNSLNTIQKAGIVSTNGLSGALKFLKIALISTGIGAIVVVFGALIAYLASTQEGIDKITSVTRPLQAIFQSLLGVAQNLGKSLFEAFSKPKELLSDLVDFIETNVMNRFKAFGVILEAIENRDFKGLRNGILQAATGVENLEDKITGAAKDTAKFLADAAAKGSEIDRLQKSIEKAEINLNKNRAIANEKAKELNIIAKDTSKTYAEREKAAKAIIDLRKKESEFEVGILDLKKQKLVVEQELNDTNREGNKELADLEAQTIDAKSKSKDAELEQIRVIAGARKEAQTKRLAQIKESQAAQKAADDATLESQKAVIDLTLTTRQKEINQINEDINKKIETFKKYGKATEQLEKERVARLNDIKRKFEEEDLQKLEDYQKALIAQQNKTIDLQISAIKNKGEREAAQRAVNFKRTVDEIDNQIKETTAKLIAGDLQQADVLAELSKQKQAIITKQKQDETQAEIDGELKKQVALAQLEFDTAKTPEQELEARHLFLEAKTALDIEKAEGDAELIKEIQVRALLEQDRIDETVMQNKIARVQQFSSVFQNLTGKNTLAAKIAAEVSAKIDAAQQLRNSVLIIQEQVKAIVSQGKLIFPLNIAAIFSTVAALASGIASAKKLVSMPKAFASGGIFESDGNGSMVRGAGTATSDSINARLSHGESVINARSTKMFAPILSALNVAGGGRALAPGYAMASGGIASGSFVTDISDGANNQTDLINGIAYALQLAPAPIVDVRDVTSMQQRNDRVVANATV